MKELTYLFGAGASFFSMPLVANFESRYKVFIEYLKTIVVDLNASNFSSQILGFYNELFSHATFDTLFKKLFHQEGTEQKILDYKRILLLYFLFEHLVIPQQYRDNANHEALKKRNLEKKFILDPRYEALIAGLLKAEKGKVEFYQNVNFLTWNYDINLIYALRNFVSPKEPIMDFISRTRDGNVFNVSNQVRVIHLNGIINDKSLNNYNTGGSEYIFKTLFTDFHNGEQKLSGDTIKFAWEENPKYNDVLIDIARKTTHLVIVGYSLPLFNRATDSTLIQNFKSAGAKLYIQDLNVSDILEVLNSNFGLSQATATKDEPDISTNTNSKSFLIPSEFF